MHSGILDTYFKATNFEEEDQDNNDDFAKQIRVLGNSRQNC